MNSLSEFDLYTLKLLKCLKVFCQNVIYQIIKDLYYYHCKSDKGNKDINKFCFEVNKKSLVKVVGGKRYFPENFTLSYKGADSHPDLDITMCIYLITLVVSKDHEPDIDKTKCWIDLCKILQDIVGIRNKLSHEDGFDMKFLNHSKKKLTENLKKISKCISNLVIFQSNDRIQIKEKYKKICKENNENINKLWRSSGQSQLKQLMKLKEEDKYGTFISDNRQKLKELYNSYIKSCPFLKDFYEEFELFATPKLTQKKDSASKISYKILLSDNRTVINKPTIILVGDSGSGKSTICQKLVQDWCNSAKSLDSDINFDFLLVIDFKASDKSLMTYIKEVLFKDSLKDESDDDVCLLLKQLKLLFIIDDYDEKLKESLHFFDIFNRFGNKNFIITTKPCYTANIFEHFGSNISYNEISIDGVEDYFELFIKKQDEISKNNVEIFNSKEFLIYLNNVPTDDYCSIPLDLPVFDLLLIYMFKNYKEDMQEKSQKKNLTVFRLYMWILKSNSFNEKKLLNICEQCYKNLKDSCTIDMQSPYCDADKDVSNISTIFKSSPTFRTGTRFEFLHKTQIEFLAAYYIADYMLEQGDKPSHTLVKFFEINMKNSAEKRESNVRIFLAVLEILIEENKIDIIGLKSIIYIIKNFSDDYNILWKVYHEILKMGKSNWIMEIDLHYQAILCPTQWKLNDSNVISAVNILRYINVTLTDLEVELKDDVTELLKLSLTKLNKKKENLLKGKPLTLIIDKETNSDVCESILKCWHHIVKMKLFAFKGYIGKQCCKILKSCNQIVKIDCRITTLETLTSFNEALGNSKWKEVQIQFDKPFETKDEPLEYIPQLNYSKAEDSKISIEFTDSKNLSLAISNLERLKPRDHKFTIVKLGNNELPREKTAKEMQVSQVLEKLMNEELILKELIKEELILTSRIDISSSDLNMLNRELHPIAVTWKKIP